MITYMFENMLHFLEPVLTVFAAIAVITLAAVVCIGCIVLAIKVGDSFKGMLKERYKRFLDKWNNRHNVVIEKVADKLGQTFRDEFDKAWNTPSEPHVDPRAFIAGKWVSKDSDSLEIYYCKGFYKMRIHHWPTRPDYDNETFIVKVSESYEDRYNVFCAEALDILTLGYSNEDESIFIPEVNITFRRDCGIPKEEIDMMFSNVSIDDVPDLSSDFKEKLMAIHSSFDEIEEAVNRNVIE